MKLGRMLSYGVWGWFWIAATASISHVAGLTIFLPMLSVVVLAHSIFETEDPPLVESLAMAVMLGYLYDLHHGHPTGVMTLGHVLAVFGLRWAKVRLLFAGGASMAMLSGAAAGMILLISLLPVWIFQVRLGLTFESYFVSWDRVAYQAVATALLAYPLDWLTTVVWSRMRRIVRPFSNDRRMWKS